MANRPGVMLYFELSDELTEFSDAECGQLLRAILKYGITGEVPDYSDRAMRTIWKGLQRRIDADGARYAEISQKRAEAGRRGGMTKASNSKQTQASVANASHAKQIYPTTTPSSTPTTATTKSMGADKPHTPAQFVKPTVDEVREYCNERGNGIDPQRFVDYYESNGWKVGRGAMKDWQASVRNWERNNKGSPAPKAEKIPAGYSTADVVEYPAGSGQYIRRSDIPEGMNYAV